MSAGIGGDVADADAVVGGEGSGSRARGGIQRPRVAPGPLLVFVKYPGGSVAVEVVHGEAVVAAGLCPMGPQGDDFAMVREGIFHAAELTQGGGEVAVGLGIVGAERQGGAVMVDGTRKGAALEQDVAEVVVRLRVVGLETDRFAQSDGGVFELAEGFECDAEVVVGLRKSGLETDDLAEVGGGLGGVPQAAEDSRGVIAEMGGGGEFDGAGEEGERFVVTVELMAGQAEEVEARQGGAGGRRGIGGGSARRGRVGRIAGNAVRRRGGCCAWVGRVVGRGHGLKRGRVPRPGAGVARTCWGGGRLGAYHIVK